MNPIAGCRLFLGLAQAQCPGESPLSGPVLLGRLTFFALQLGMSAQITLPPPDTDLANTTMAIWVS